MQPTFVSLNTILAIIFVALQAVLSGTSFNQQSVSAFSSLFLDKIPGVVGNKNLKNVTPPMFQKPDYT